MEKGDFFKSEFLLKRFDPRISRSLSKGYAEISRSAGSSFSFALGDNFRQTMSRIFQRKNMNGAALLSGHIACTQERCLEDSGSYVIVAQDSSYYNLSGHKKMRGLTAIQGKVLGVVQHNVLAMSELGVPLGLLAQHNWARGGEGSELWKKESEKWNYGLDAVNRHLGSRKKKVILVQDREADIFDFIQQVRSPNVELLLRVYQERLYEIGAAGDTSLSTAYLRQSADSLPYIESKTVEIRRNNQAVWVKLALYAGEVSVLPPKNAPKDSRPISMTLVKAVEIGAEDSNFADVYDPKTKVEWLLLSSAKLSPHITASQLVEWYALRWGIERFHYVLKSGGYEVERLQFDDIHTYLNALAFYSVVAWKMLAFNKLVQEEPLTPANVVFDKDEIETMTAITKEPVITIEQAEKALNIIARFKPSKAQKHLGNKKMAKAIYDLQFVSFGFHINNSS